MECFCFSRKWSGLKKLWLWYLSWRLSTQCLGEFKHGVEVATLNRKREDEDIGRVHPSRFWFTISRVSLSMSCFLLFKALVLITLGGNDFVNNYYLVPNYARSRQFAIPNCLLKYQQCQLCLYCFDRIYCC